MNLEGTELQATPPGGGGIESVVLFFVRERLVVGDGWTAWRWYAPTGRSWLVSRRSVESIGITYSSTCTSYLLIAGGNQSLMSLTWISHDCEPRGLRELGDTLADRTGRPVQVKKIE